MLFCTAERTKGGLSLLLCSSHAYERWDGLMDVRYGTVAPSHLQFLCPVVFCIRAQHARTLPTWTGFLFMGLASPHVYQLGRAVLRALISAYRGLRKYLAKSFLSPATSTIWRDSRAQQAALCLYKLQLKAMHFSAHKTFMPRYQNIDLQGSRTQARQIKRHVTPQNCHQLQSCVHPISFASRVPHLQTTI